MASCSKRCLCCDIKSIAVLMRLQAPQTRCWKGMGTIWARCDPYWLDFPDAKCSCVHALCPGLRVWT